MRHILSSFKFRLAAALLLLPSLSSAYPHSINRRGPIPPDPNIQLTLHPPTLLGEDDNPQTYLPVELSAIPAPGKADASLLQMYEVVDGWKGVGSDKRVPAIARSMSKREEWQAEVRYLKKITQVLAYGDDGKDERKWWIITKKAIAEPARTTPEEEKDIKVEHPALQNISE